MLKLIFQKCERQLIMELEEHPKHFYNFRKKYKFTTCAVINFPTYWISAGYKKSQFMNLLIIKSSANTNIIVSHNMKLYFFNFVFFFESK